MLSILFLDPVSGLATAKLNQVPDGLCNSQLTKTDSLLVIVSNIALESTVLDAGEISRCLTLN